MVHGGGTSTYEVFYKYYRAKSDAQTKNLEAAKRKSVGAAACRGIKV